MEIEYFFWFSIIRYFISYYIIDAGRNSWWWLQPYLRHIKMVCDTWLQPPLRPLCFPFLDCDMNITFNESVIIKLTTFLVTVILNFVFPNVKIWFTQVMSSLCQKPRLMPYLYSILQKVHVSSVVEERNRVAISSTS